jgi:hypothetical protein
MAVIQPRHDIFATPGGIKIGTAFDALRTAALTENFTVCKT